MEEKQLTFKEEEITRMLNRAFDLFREGEFSDAEAQLEKALAIDFDYPDLSSSLKCAGLWKANQTHLGQVVEPYERGELLLDQWRHFVRFVDKIGGTSEKGMFSIRHYVFSTALRNYESLEDDRDAPYAADLFARIGRCYKELGSYDRAIEHLEKANQLRNGVPSTLAELADCYALVGESRAAKIFFREAFFVAPEQIEVAALESAMARRLVDRARSAGIEEDALPYWLAIFGTIHGVFTVKRELRPLEYGRLRQSIYQMEQQLEAGEPKDASLVPRLLNHYFWLIDHYTTSGEERYRVEETLEKIKRVDRTVYAEYIR
jgi:tetratricopeptide (TPR) repeat protein